MLERKDMHYNFDMILPRVVDSFNSFDDERANHILKNIRGNCICTGTGGSNSASLFASVVLEEVNKIIAVSKEPRDVLFMNLFYNWKYLIGITYGNNNYGIDEAEMYARESKLETHLITANSSYEEDICYKGIIPNEYSFISLVSTITPMSILLNYYLKHSKETTIELINELFMSASKKQFENEIDKDFPLFEIMSGDDTYVASKILESTITEAGLGMPVVHEKYSYCHGRSTLAHSHKKSNLIYLLNGDCSNLDKKLLAEIKDIYNNIIVLHSPNHDRIIGEFDLAMQSLFLCKDIAVKEQKDLSKVEYAGIVKKLYKYNGGM